MRYDAFISYRHAPLDMEVAKKIHTGLETYKIPRSVQNKTGKKKMGRVFRDQEELPIGSDLDDNISTALAESKYLIVICSPRTPESYWVCKEIENFIKMHDRNHVLAVLIEGEPAESFPPQLLTDEDGNPVEPLAADVRGADKKERNHKYKTELLRLAAPVIGCTYDELRQRHRERVIRKTVTLASAAAGVIAVSGMSFGIYNANVAAKMKQLANEKSQLADEKSKLAEEKSQMADEITEQYKGKQENQSRFYAEEALSLFNAGNRADAVLVAKEGLPSEGNERPYVAESEYALATTLYAYDCGKNVSFERNLSHSLPISYMERTDDFKRLVTIDNGGKVYVWNSEDWSLELTIEPSVNSSNYFESVVCADADDTGLYVATSKSLTKYGYDGNVIFTKDFDSYISKSDVLIDRNEIFVACYDEIVRLNPENGDVISTIPNNSDLSFSKEGRYYKADGLYIIGHGLSDEGNTLVSFVDLDNNTTVDTQVSTGFILDFCKTDNGNYAFLSGNSDMIESGVTDMIVDLIDKNGNVLWSKRIDANVREVLTFDSIIMSHSYEEGGKTQSDVVVTIESDAFTLDEETGETRVRFNLPGQAKMVALSSGNSFGRVGYRSGNIDFVNFETGQIHSEFNFQTNASIRDSVLYSNAIVFSSFSSPDLHVLTWHEAPDSEEFLNFDYNVKSYNVSPDSEYFSLGAAEFVGAVTIFDKNGEEVYTTEDDADVDAVFFSQDKAYFDDRGCFWAVDLAQKSAEKIMLADYGFDFTLYDMSISKDGKTAAFWTSHDALIFDLENKTKICQSRAEGKIGYIIPASDGKTVYISEAGENLYAYDCVAEEATYVKDDMFRTISDGYGCKFMDLSKDGKYIALCCLDGKMRVADTTTMETVTEIDMAAYYYPFVSFTDDGKHLVMQGDDYNVIICETKTGEIVSKMEANGLLKYIVCDEDSDILAVAFGGGLLLYNTKSYGCVASVEEGLVYLGGDNSILLTNDHKIVNRIHYKNYTELLAEADKQFGNSTLSAEKKLQYNIN